MTSLKTSDSNLVPAPPIQSLTTNDRPSNRAVRQVRSPDRFAIGPGAYSPNAGRRHYAAKAPTIPTSVVSPVAADLDPDLWCRDCKVSGRLCFC